MPYTSLKAEKVIQTIEKLEKRISERFPESGLLAAAGELKRTAQQCAAESEKLQRPVLPIRLSVYAIWVFGAAGLLALALGIPYGGVKWEAASLVQVLEPAMNLAVLVGLGVLGLGGLEQRWKRAKALDYLHQLRSVAHVVDMHQLTKDPYRGALPTTPSSPHTTMHGPLLERYLDYCSEMLSLTGKLAALFAQSCRDTEVAAGASDVEQLTTALSRKIWQKVMAFSRMHDVNEKRDL